MSQVSKSWRRLMPSGAASVEAQQPDEPLPVSAPPAARSVALPRALARIDPLFVLMLFIGAVARFVDLNWDQGTHIHPDERFLTMVGNAERLPSSLGQYLNPATSPLNPANVGSPGQYSFFVYGTLPVTLNKIFAIWLGHDNYNDFTLQGRFLSALADLLVLPLIYLTARLFERHYGFRPQIKYVAMFFYAVAVLPIQLAHFFAVDSFQNLFVFASFYFSLRYALKQGWLNVGLAAVAFGCAVACKTSAVYALPLDLVFLVLPFLPELTEEAHHLPGGVRALLRQRDLLRRALDALWTVIVFGLVSYVALRLADPAMFQNASLLDPKLSTLFLNNLNQLQGFNNPDAGYPPGVQWINKPPIIFALGNLVLFGIGVPFFLFFLVGVAQQLSRRARIELFIILLWMLAVFLFQSIQYTKNMRYFIILYPFIAILAAAGFSAVVARMGMRYRAVLVAALLVWPLAFMSIYTQDHSRVAASKWIYANIPSGSVMLSESWDDALPLYNVPNPNNRTYPGSIPAPQSGPIRQELEAGHYVQNGQLQLSMPVFDPDTAPGKWADIHYLLDHAGYLILSSNRGWGSMTSVPNRYPLITRYYSDLFAGKLHYRLVKEFTSYPSLRYLGIPIDFNDSWSEESFTVYDHPVVMIFKHVR